MGDLISIQTWLREVGPEHEEYNKDDYARMIHYLAQTYKGSTLYEMGLKYYLQRAELANMGWYEERYISYYEAAACGILTNLDAYLIDDYLRKAITIIPERLEARYALVRRRCEALHFNEAYGIGASFMDNHITGTKYGLAVDVKIYQWLFDDQCAVALFSAVDCGPKIWRMEKCCKVWERILNKRKDYLIDKVQIKRIAINLIACYNELGREIPASVSELVAVPSNHESEQHQSANSDTDNQGSSGGDKNGTEVHTPDSRSGTDSA